MTFFLNPCPRSHDKFFQKFCLWWIKVNLLSRSGIKRSGSCSKYSRALHWCNDYEVREVATVVDIDGIITEFARLKGTHLALCLKRPWSRYCLTLFCCKHTGEFDQKFSKKSNARGFSRGGGGMGGFGIDWLSPDYTSKFYVAILKRWILLFCTVLFSNCANELGIATHMTHIEKNKDIYISKE